MVKIYTDGSCLGNGLERNFGGYAAVIIEETGENEKIIAELFDKEENTTNNRMEMAGAIIGLEFFKTPTQLTLYSDSKYLVDMLNSWIYKWHAFGWKRRKDSTNEIKNLDLVKKLYYLITFHEVKVEWVKGHAGNIWNERADFLANSMVPTVKHGDFIYLKKEEKQKLIDSLLK